MSNMKVPGIYISEQKYNLNSLQIDSRCLTGFAGITEQGPLNKPVYLTSFDEYLDIFGGFDTAGVMPLSVYSYFKSGGKECVCVRVANAREARNASLKLGEKENYVILTANTSGHWGNYIVASLWKESSDYFSLTLKYRNKNESFIHLSFDMSDERYFVSYINTHSKLCSIKSHGKLESLEGIFMKPFTGGMDGIAKFTPRDYIGKYEGLENYAGIGCFESRDDISLVACPDLCWFKNTADAVTVQKALVEQAERFPGRFAILDVPKSLDVVDASDWAGKMVSQHSAAYYPFINITDPLDATGIGTVCIPPSGSVCGCIAAIDGEKGIFHAPANCILEGAVGTTVPTTTGEQEILYDSRINFLKYFPGKGVKIWGAKTLSCDKEWGQINVRRTFSRVCAALKEGTQWAVFENNDKNLRKRLVRQVSGFLLDLWMKGYFAGSTAEQGFYVKCDEELNPPENIDAGILTFEVGLAIVRPVEFFKITITAEKDGASVYVEE